MYGRDRCHPNQMVWLDSHFWMSDHNLVSNIQLLKSCLKEKNIQPLKSTIDHASTINVDSLSCSACNGTLHIKPLHTQASFSGSVIDTVTQTGILKTVLVECHGDDTPLTFHDTPLFFFLILLVHVSKFNVHDTLMTLPLPCMTISSLCSQQLLLATYPPS